MTEDKEIQRRGAIFQPSRLYQIGIVVKNVEETVRYWEKLFGFGPFELRDVSFPTATYHGRTAGYRGKRAYFRLGPLEIEVIELVEGKTVHEDFLREKGEGMHHIAFIVDSIEESIDNAEQLGLKVTQSFTHPDGSGFAYLDSDRIGGVVIELVQRPPKTTG